MKIMWRLEDNSVSGERESVEENTGGISQRDITPKFFFGTV